MKKALPLLGFAALWVVAGAAWAGEQTGIFAVEKMNCGLCPLTVTKAIEKVAGVSAVEVSFERKEAVVVYDDAVATPEEIIAASTNAGYPARLKDAT